MVSPVVTGARMPTASPVPRTLLLFVVLFFAIALPRTTSAATPTRALVVITEGSSSPGAVAALRTELDGSFAVTDGKDLRASLGRWSKANLLGALAGDGRENLLNDLARAARARGIDAVLLVEVRSTRRDRTARLVLVDVRSPLAPVETETKLAARPVARADAARVHAVLGPRLSALNEGDSSASSDAGPLVAATTEEPTLTPSVAPSAPATAGEEKDARG